jgi:hypothetical protein
MARTTRATTSSSSGMSGAPCLVGWAEGSGQRPSTAARHGGTAAVASGQARQAGLVGPSGAAGRSAAARRGQQPGDRGGLVQLGAGSCSPARTGDRWPAVAAVPGCCTLMGVPPVAGIPLPARAWSMPRRRPGGLDEGEDFTAADAQPTRPRQPPWGTHHGAEDAPQLDGGVGRRADAAPGDQAVGPDQQCSPRPDAMGGQLVCSGWGTGSWQPWKRANNPRRLAHRRRPTAVLAACRLGLVRSDLARGGTEGGPEGPVEAAEVTEAPAKRDRRDRPIGQARAQQVAARRLQSPIGSASTGNDPASAGQLLRPCLVRCHQDWQKPTLASRGSGPVAAQPAGVSVTCQVMRSTTAVRPN